MNNESLSRRLFIWIAAATVAISAVSTAASFFLTFEDANELQDAQLVQIAGTLATQASITPATRFRPRDSEDAETHLVVHVLGTPPLEGDPHIDAFLPESLQPGLHTVDQHGVRWRVMVATSAGGQRFGVAQRQTVRDEIAGGSALLTLAPLAILVPLLLFIVHRLLRQGFARTVQLSREVDQVDAERLAMLDPSGVPSEALPLVLAVNRLLARLGSVLEQQRRMVADAAHELRTPVAVVRVQADNLGNAELSADARSRLNILQSGLGRISQLIEKLLDLARVQGSSSLKDEVFSFDAEVRRAVEETLPLALQRGIDLGVSRLDIVEAAGQSAHAFALARNVIDNAVRYSPDGGSVDVCLEHRDGRILLIVDDSGPGIPADKRERVFEPFFRVLGSQQPGTGLGLAIVRSAAQALRGEVALRERPDGLRGTRFAYSQPALTRAAAR
jgi:signal transduction histidine kinase